MIEFFCHKCGKKLKVSDAASGKRGKCPQCGTAVNVPEAVESADEGIRAGILDEIEENNPSGNPEGESTEVMDPDVLWERAQTYKRAQRHKREQSPGTNTGWSWNFTFPKISKLLLLVALHWVGWLLYWVDLDGSDVPADNLFVGCVVTLGVAAYWIPSFVAYNRHHQNRDAILMLNLLTGWSFIGWVISMVWAVKKVEK